MIKKVNLHEYVLNGIISFVSEQSMPLLILDRILPVVFLPTGLYIYDSVYLKGFNTRPNYWASASLHFFIKQFFKRSNILRYRISFFTPPRNRGGVIFSMQFVCVSLCVCVCVSGTSCEQNSSRTNAPIWTRFSLNGCLPHWLEPELNLVTLD